MAEIVRRRSWGGVLPLGRHASIRGSSFIQCASVSIALSSVQEGQNAIPVRRFKLEQALEDLISQPLIVYPAKPRPSYADQVLSILQERGLKPNLFREVRELQTALGLVAAAVGVSLVPAAVQRLRRDDVVYRPLQDATATSPIIMCYRM